MSQIPFRKRSFFMHVVHKMLSLADTSRSQIDKVLLPYEITIAHCMSWLHGVGDGKKLITNLVFTMIRQWFEVFSIKPNAKHMFKSLEEKQKSTLHGSDHCDMSHFATQKLLLKCVRSALATESKIPWFTKDVICEPCSKENLRTIGNEWCVTHHQSTCSFPHDHNLMRNPTKFDLNECKTLVAQHEAKRKREL